MLTHRTTPNHYYSTCIITFVILPVIIYVLQLYEKSSLLVVFVVSILFCAKVARDALIVLFLPAQSTHHAPPPRCRYCFTTHGSLVSHPTRSGTYVCQHCYERYLLSPEYLNVLLRRGR